MSEIDWFSLTPAEQQTLLDGPALAPPDGTSHFANPPNQNAVSYVVIILCLSLSSVFLFLRAYVTFSYLKRPYLSDYLMTLAWLIYVPFMSLLLVEIGYLGYFVHLWDVRLRDLPRQLFLFTVGTSLFVVTVALVKAAILLEWVRIFVARGTRNYFFWIAQCLLTVNALINIAALFIINLTCIPHEKIWNRLMVRGHCLQGHAIDITSASINLAIDLLILLLPQRVIWTLQLSTNRKRGIAAIFAVGLLGCIAAVFRLVATVQYSFSPDVTYNFSAVALWAVAETTCGMLVYAVPTAPKAYASLLKLVPLASVRSWSTRKSKDKSPFPSRSAYNERLRPRVYEELDDSQLVTMDTFGSGAVRSVSHSSMHDGIPEEETQQSILRTTHISTKSEPVDGGAEARNWLNRQQPWEPHAI
ncbi:hypothetical protein F5Y14DRAFT_415118 [Nemania sp. NC0429]|nr:hypothetical protein F5Y14DRAFT_415118 [Nemania sp. NC0429]